MATPTERLGTITNLVHGFIYFSTEASSEYLELGLTGRSQYFASRAAAMGAVGPELVVATFFNFNPQVVHDALPAAWAIAEPTAVQQARMRAASQVLQPICDTCSASDLAEATQIATTIVEGIGFEGKPLAAANSAVPLPEDPTVRLWQLISIVREWRGDAHVAALTTAPVSGIEALILHAATGQVPAPVLQATRAWSDEAWAQGVAGLADRGLVDADGSFTDQGRSLRADIEARTNASMSPLVAVVGDSAINRLCDLLKPIRNGLLESGIFGQGLGGTRD